MKNYNSILCVDDDEIILLALRRSIQSHFKERFIYETAKNAEEAIETIEDLFKDGIKVVLIISDWQMPGMKGDELLIYIKNNFPGIASIMITGQADEDAKKRVLNEAGAVKIFDKPWNANELFQTIERICEEMKI
ncbi:MAG: response regulator [Leptospiraceae bacterium]|nr:response regulator [Leptospiraceae bacterium]